MSTPITEACVDSLEQAVAAEQNGASRIELCSRLDLDGLTPDLQLTREILNQVSIPIHVMIRQRGGNFVFSDSEIDEQVSVIQQFQGIGIEGIVIGALTDQNQVDIQATQKLANAAGNLNCTFHKAIDELADPAEGIEQLLNISGITHVLTSGGAPTALEGQGVLRKMKVTSSDKIKIIAAGKVTNKNIEEVQKATKADEFHGKLIVGSLS